MEEPKENIFVCQKCQKLIHFDFSIGLRDEDWDAFKKSVASNTGLPHDEFLDNSFVFINEKVREIAPPSDDEQYDDAEDVEFVERKQDANFNMHLNERMKTLTKIIEIASGHSEVQHPLCASCSNQVRVELQADLAELRGEREKCAAYIQNFENQREQFEAMDMSDIKRIRDETADLEAQIVQVRQDRAVLQRELQRLQEESKEVDHFEDLFFRDANDFWYEIDKLTNEHSAVREKIREVSNQLEIMKRTNVYDDAFHISHDGHFGTINGLRLGRLPSISVDWEEINAGFGQSVLLLDVLSRRCQPFRFNRFELQPLGSNSVVSEKSDRGRIVLHSMFVEHVMFGYRQCDTALECFLECIRQFAHWIKTEKDPNFRLKYPIRRDEIGDASRRISVRFSNDKDGGETWTRALKYMLIDLKYLLAWVAGYSM